jgi:hypothetical protein
LGHNLGELLRGRHTRVTGEDEETTVTNVWLRSQLIHNLTDSESNTVDHPRSDSFLVEFRMWWMPPRLILQIHNFR